MDKRIHEEYISGPREHVERSDLENNGVVDVPAVADVVPVMLRPGFPPFTYGWMTLSMNDRLDMAT